MIKLRSPDRKALLRAIEAGNDGCGAAWLADRMWPRRPPSGCWWS